MNTALDSQYHSELLREIDARARARGWAVGVARGKARAVLIVLDARGVQVPDVVRDRILACTDLDQLDSWLRRATVTASTTAEDVIQP